MKITLTLLLTLCINILSAQHTDSHLQAEQMPYFKGCEDLPDGSREKRNCSNHNLINFIAEHLTYPAKAKSEGTEGTVYVSFTVNTEGQVLQPEILHDIGGDCGREALRVVNLMPKFTPAMNDGQATEVKLNLPVRFSLSKAEDNAAGFTITWGALQGNKVSREDLEANLTQEITVRDRKGDVVLIDELIFSYEKNNRLINEKSRGEIDKSMEKVILKAKKGGVFTIAVSVQTGAEFIYVDRSFEVIE